MSPLQDRALHRHTSRDSCSGASSLDLILSSCLCGRWHIRLQQGLPHLRRLVTRQAGIRSLPLSDKPRMAAA